MNLSDRWDLTPTACCDQEMWCTCRNLPTGLVLLSGMRYRTPLVSESPLHHPLSFSLKYVEQMIELLLFCHRLSMEFYWETLKNLNEQTKFPFNDTDLKKNLNINKNILRIGLIWASEIIEESYHYSSPWNFAAYYIPTTLWGSFYSDF